MSIDTLTRRRAILTGLAATGSVVFDRRPGFSAEPTWKPTRNVEIVVGVAPGGSMDRSARFLDDAMRKGKLVPRSSIVLNKPGGGHAVALAYTVSRRGDANVIQVINTPLLTNKILGRSTHTYTDTTPIGTLFVEHFMFAVRRDSPIRDAEDLLKRLKADPSSVSYAVSSGVGTVNEMAALLIARNLGIDPKKLKPVSFNSASEGVAMALGGHVDVVITVPFSIVPFILSNDLRGIAIGSETRLGGALASVPTWREVGMDILSPGFRVVIAPPDLRPEQIAYWESCLDTIARMPMWQKQIDMEYMTSRVMGSADTTAYLKAEYDRYTEIYRSVGII